MADNTAKEILQRQQALAAARSSFETLWQQIAERVLPGSASFLSKPNPGEARTEKMMDATAGLALRKYATILESLATPRNQRWHRLNAEAEYLQESAEVKRYYEDLNQAVFKARYAPSSNFTGQVGACYLEHAAFGNAALFIDSEDGYGLRYKAIPLSELYFCENHVGQIDTNYRRFELTARQAELRYGDRLPEAIKKAAEKSPDAKFWFVNCVRPNDGAREDKLLADMKFQSVTVAEQGMQTILTAGYYTFPYAVMRDLTASGEIYGRSPAVWALPDIKMLNEMNRTVIRAGHKALDPPVLLTEDGALTGFNLRPGALNPGGLASDGTPLAAPFQTGARIDLGFELMQAKQAVINDAFFITLFQILVENPKMTATEVMERAQEKGMLLGPLMGRMQSEFLGPLIERELDLLARQGGTALPPVPEELAQEGILYKIEYESPLARAQRAEEGVAILRTLEATAPFLEIRPELLDVFDLDEAFRTLGEVNGMSQKLIRPKDQIEEIRAQRAEEQQAMQMAEAAPGMAGAVKDLADAGAAAGA